MSNNRKRWQVAPAALPSHIHSLPDLNPITVQVLYNRGITSAAYVATFLADHPDDDGPFDPFDLPDMDKAVSRLGAAIGSREPIVVYGDFDVDGVAATVLLLQTLSALGADVKAYIPNRLDEGYGLHNTALTKLAQREQARVIVTVDCGIRAVEEVAYANELGLDVIITDHHSVGSVFPPALAVIDPKRGDSSYGYRELAGVGVAYKLAQALLRSNQEHPLRDAEVRLKEADLLDLVALGTVADIVPLTGENRALVRRGLKVLNRLGRPGIEALSQRTRLAAGQIDARAIGFTLGPRINAAGRLGQAEKALHLLAAEYSGEAEQLADELESLNRERRRLTRLTEEKARLLAGPEIDTTALIFAAAPGLSPGIVGLAASRLSQEFHRPAIVVEIGEDTSRGSARSIPEFHITRALDSCSDLLIRHGGHAAAAGFTVANENLKELEDRLRATAQQELAERDLTPALIIDADITLDQLTWDLQRELDRLEPYGCQNPVPLFVSRNVRVLRCRGVGADDKHLKMKLGGRDGSWDAIAFRQGDWLGKLPDRVDIAYHFEVNRWNGIRQLQLNVQELKPASS